MAREIEAQSEPMGFRLARRLAVPRSYTMT
jgi:hypothetical protein